jgi:ketosteroid isomerase-like protein
MTTTTSEILTEPYAQAQAEVTATVHAIMAAATRRDVDALDAFHAFGPKFTKFDDFEPLARQDAETTRRLEREAVCGVAAFTARVEDLKVDVFGPAAVATFVLDYGAVTNDDETMAFRARATLVLVTHQGRWLIVHEHLSPFTAQI